MNRVLLILAGLFIATSIAFDVNYFNYSFPVEHKNFKSITLDDFKGLKKIGGSLNGNNEFAFIKTEIKAQGNQYPYVKAFFHPSRSYVFNKNTSGGKNLLIHELYHFHITECIVRKIRKEIATNGMNGFSLSEIIERYKIEENKLQFSYDNDTYHSYYMGEQLAWQNKIDSLLNTLTKYR